MGDIQGNINDEVGIGEKFSQLFCTDIKNIGVERINLRPVLFKRNAQSDDINGKFFGNKMRGNTEPRGKKRFAVQFKLRLAVLLTTRQMFLTGYLGSVFTAVVSILKFFHCSP